MTLPAMSHPFGSARLSPALREEILTNLAERLPLFALRYERVQHDEARAAEVQRAFAEDVMETVLVLSRGGL